MFSRLTTIPEPHVTAEFCLEYLAYVSEALVGEYLRLMPGGFSSSEIDVIWSHRSLAVSLRFSFDVCLTTSVGQLTLLGSANLFKYLLTKFNVNVYVIVYDYIQSIGREEAENKQ